MCPWKHHGAFCGFLVLFLLQIFRTCEIQVKWWEQLFTVMGYYDDNGSSCRWNWSRLNGADHHPSSLCQLSFACGRLLTINVWLLQIAEVTIRELVSGSDCWFNRCFRMFMIFLFLLFYFIFFVLSLSSSKFPFGKQKGDIVYNRSDISLCDSSYSLKRFTCLRCCGLSTKLTAALQRCEHDCRLCLFAKRDCCGGRGDCCSRGLTDQRHALLERTHTNGNCETETKGRCRSAWHVVSGEEGWSCSFWHLAALLKMPRNASLYLWIKWCLLQPKTIYPPPII